MKKKFQFWKTLVGQNWNMFRSNMEVVYVFQVRVQNTFFCTKQGIDQGMLHAFARFADNMIDGEDYD